MAFYTYKKIIVVQHVCNPFAQICKMVIENKNHDENKSTEYGIWVSVVNGSFIFDDQNT